MKNVFRRFLPAMIALLIPASYLHAEGSGTADLPAPENTPSVSPTPFEAKDPVFHVMSDRGSDDAAQLIREMALRFNFFNRFFRYDGGDIALPLRVRAFSEKESYDTYVSARLGTTRRGAVYLHYENPERRELVVHRGSPDERAMLPREAFIQYFRAFVANPPSWLREGFAIYFSSLRYDPVAGELEYSENLSWLERVKNPENRTAPPELVFLADSLGMPDNFAQLSWALVSFFINSEEGEYYRTMAEILMLIPGEAPARDNAELVTRHISRWNDMDALKKDYEAYIASRRTFNDLIRDGQQAFSNKDLVAAELNFQAALNQRPGHYSPYYYLGLISCERKDYEAADNFYRLALERGASPALVYYARGVNAASAGLREDAISYLTKAAEANPGQYQERAGTIIGILTTEQSPVPERPAESQP